LSLVRGSLSLRKQLLIGILLPIALFILVDTVSLYRQALGAVNVAYDRTLLASAKAIGELIDIAGEGESAQLRASVPYSVLEAFEADNRSRMVYRVGDARGQWIDGDRQLRAWSGTLPDQGPYSALVDFYDDTVRGEAVRVAVLLQPVASGRERAMATVQVAETLEIRRDLARQILLDTLRRQILLIGVITLVVLLVVQRVTGPVRSLSQSLDQRGENDLTAITATDLPAEIQPLTDATNRVMARLMHLLEHQKRFVRDAAHQLRTPLAVLKVQVQSALRGDLQAQTALQDIEETVDWATALANQMLNLAKVEQLRQLQDFTSMDWTSVVHNLALEMSPLVAQKNINFDWVAAPCRVMAHEWMLRELVRNVLHNAIRFTPEGGDLSVRMQVKDQRAVLEIQDSGPGLSAALQARLFQPFSAGDTRSGSGLGLTIAREIVLALNGTIELKNQVAGSTGGGLVATISLPVAGV
jgi:two-component system sensor histidine kinase TctE